MLIPVVDWCGMSSGAAPGPVRQFLIVPTAPMRLSLNLISRRS
jgi:hypothetical protein